MTNTLLHMVPTLHPLNFATCVPIIVVIREIELEYLRLRSTEV